MLKRLFVLSTIVLAFVSRGHAETSYDSLAAKASRFYAQKEWQSALAMYYLMLDERPTSCADYSRAIAVAGMADDTQAQKRLTKSAFAHRVAVDSLFSGVWSEAVNLGDAHIFENYLADVVTYEPWLDRVASAGLLKYFLFRRNGPKTIEYAEKMLRGLPGDINFMQALAQGYLDSNNIAGAETVYKSILAEDADNLTALLYLGNAALQQGDKKAGAEYLRRAYRLNPTPHLERILEKL